MEVRVKEVVAWGGGVDMLVLDQPKLVTMYSQLERDCLDTRGCLVISSGGSAT
jgi:hypothetical protein